MTDKLTLQERLARLQARAPKIEEPTYACSNCLEGDGWLVVESPTGPNFVEPCEVCRTSTYERWSEGHYNPKHKREFCPECQAARRSPVSAKRS